MRKELKSLVSNESNVFRPSGPGISNENDVIKEEHENEDLVSTLNDEESKHGAWDEKHSPLKFLAASETPSNSSMRTPASTLRHDKTPASASAGTPPLPTDFKRTRSEFVSKEMRRTHAKDLVVKIEETDSDSDLDQKSKE